MINCIIIVCKSILDVIYYMCGVECENVYYL